MLHETSFQIIILSAVKTGLLSYYDNSYSRDGLSQMWILRNSKDILGYMQSRSISSCNSMKTFDFSTLYTTIPHSKLKDRWRTRVFDDICHVWWTFYSRQSSYLKLQTVLLFSPAYLLIRMRQTTYRVFLRTKPSNKRDNFRLPIVNFPFICSNISAAPIYGVYVS